MVAKTSRAQPSSPATGSAASTPKPGRRLTRASATPTKRKAAKPGPKAQTKDGAKDSKKRKVVVEDDTDQDEDPPTPSENSSSSDDESGDAFDPESSGSDEELVEDEEESEVDSDFLDESEEEQKRRKSSSRASGSRPVKKSRPSNGSGKQAVKVDDEEDEEDEDANVSEVELEEGQVIAGRLYPAPTTGQVPAGRISRNTFKFLKNLQIPERNDRDWFRSHEPSFRQAEKEWKAFVERVQLKFFEADDEIPILPPKDVIHRIYRDVRFSSDKTPYKKSFSMSTSRGGRKGIWAGYYLGISPNGNSVLAAGVWQPGKDELANMRQSILRDPTVLRNCISRPDFVEMFGPPKPGPKGKRQNVFGHEDALKVAPKLEGVDKTHKDIDLLKLRSIAVVKNFGDDEVLQEDFQDRIKAVLDVVAPFVHTLNNAMTLPGTGDADDDDDDDEEDEDGDDGDDDE